MQRKPSYPVLLLAAFTVLAPPAGAELAVFHGRVVLEDGSPPGRLVSIQRICDGLGQPAREGSASAKTGIYILRLNVGDLGGVFAASYGTANAPCVLEATLDGYISSRLDMSDPHFTMSPQLPDIVLTRIVKGSHLDLTRGPSVPGAASRPWSQALKFIDARDWAAAEVPLRAVVLAAPKFAPGWLALGTVCKNQHKAAEARPALERATQLDAKPLAPWNELASVECELKDWEAAATTSQMVIQADSRHIYLEAYIVNAIARYQRKDLDGALERIREVPRLDKRQDFPRAEYILGMIEEANHEYDSAGAHMREYLARSPRAKDAAMVKERVANLGHASPADLSGELDNADLHAPAAGEAPVPGGVKAFAAIARIPGAVSSSDFFLQYCRAITQGGPNAENQTLASRDAIRAFIAAVPELEQLGTRQADRVVVPMAVDTDEHRHKAERVLALLGWKLVRNADALTIEPGEQEIDGLRQRIPAAFGIDELDLRQTIEAGRPFQFEIPVENARLIGGPAWGVTLKDAPDFPGGPVEIFIRDWRFARVYTGLGAMDPEAAGAVVSAVGLPTLLTKYANLLADAGDALTVSEKHVAVPGGAKANPAWARLAGANPQNPGPFLRALLDKDEGRLMAFYYDLARADAAHQQFFTANAGRAEAFYKWYRDSLPARLPEDRWQATILQNLGLDAGKPAFPGGRQAWPSAASGDDDVILHLPSLRALAAEIQLEQRRGSPLDQASAALLAQHYDEWQYLFPYFEKLPGLGAAEFQALAGFAGDAAAASVARQTILLGEWHSLVELIVLAGEAGSLDPAGAAKAFRQVAEALRSGNPSSQSVAVLRAVAGGVADLDDAIPARLLRLSAARRDSYERVKALQKVPSIASLGDSPDAAKTLAALSGAVYAALLEAQVLLVAEDPRLVAKHNFLPAGNDKRALFADSALILSNSPPGSNLTGGFGRFREVTRSLDRRRLKPADGEETAGEGAAPEEALPAESAPAESGPRPPTEALFRASGRIVEVYATVTDSRGRYVDDLTAAQFTILESGQTRPVFAFENHTSSVSVALLFDTTGSMEGALPSLKSAALHFLRELRPEDSAAVYSFNNRVNELQSFTTDKVAAERAVLRAHASGTTALYDALLRVNHDMSGRPGKKVILVFTDGDDNASMLTSDAAILRAKVRGIPIYTIAEGDALVHPQLIGELANMSRATGGTSFLIRKLGDISAVFQKVSEDLMHGYLVAFQPSDGPDNGWRKIEVVLANGKGRQVRAREGYYPE